MATRPSSQTAPVRSPQARRRSAADSLAGIFAICLTASLLCGFYFGRDVVVPLALGALIAFLLSPLVTRLARWTGNVLAVVLSMLLVLAAVVGLGWMLGKQAVDFANQLPSYKENLRAKIRSVQAPKGGVISKISDTVADLRKDLPGAAKNPAGPATTASSKPTAGTSSNPPPMPVRLVADGNSAMDVVKTLASPVIGPLETTAIVLLLATFMLLQREDLRSRLLRLIGQSNLSKSTKALDEASLRVRRFLLMQLVVNTTYGIPLALGLHFIGVPNAALWGALAAVLRFIPYIGPWIAAAFPIALSLAISPDWSIPMMTIGLFVLLELISNNVLEPLLYGSSTGVSSIALIVSAMFWTWLWGPAGLILSTPLTVCLVVMGRHIPHLSFLSVVLGEDQPLSPRDDCYQRLLRQGPSDEAELAQAYLKDHPAASLYDDMLVPTVVAIEADHADGAIDREHRDRMMEALSDLLDDVSEHLPAGNPDAGAPFVRVIPVRAERDYFAARMAAHALALRGLRGATLPVVSSMADAVDALREDVPDAIVISVTTPSRPSHARRVCANVRHLLPSCRILIGLWDRADEDLDEDRVQLLAAGADSVVVSITQLCDTLAPPADGTP